MPNVYATANYDNYRFIVEDVYLVGGNYVVTGITNLVYALADYPHWQVLTLSSLYKPDTYNAAALSSAINITITRPLVVISSKKLITSVAGVFGEQVRYPFYDHISNVFIQPEDGIPQKRDNSRKSNEVENDDNC